MVNAFGAFDWGFVHLCPLEVIEEKVDRLYIR